MINLLSEVKRKNQPLAPSASPDFKIAFWLKSRSNDYKISEETMPSDSRS